MKAADIELLAAAPDGRLFAAAPWGAIALLEAGAAIPFAEVLPLTGPEGAVALSALTWFGDSLVAANQIEHCLLRIGSDGVPALLAGAPRPPLAMGGGGIDGPASVASFRSPRLLAPSGARLYVVEAATSGFAVRSIEDACVGTVPLAGPGGPEISAAAGDGAGGFVLADARGLCLYRAEGDGRVTLLAGSPNEAGSDDGAATTARFARITAIAHAKDRGWAVIDGARLRMVARDGSVSTLAGATADNEDGTRFGAISSLVVGVDGTVFVADRDARAVLAIDESGLVSTVLQDARPPETPLGDAEARDLARRFAQAVVSSDDRAALAIVERFLADHASRGAAEPDLTRMPVSVALARVGRELALQWCRWGRVPLARVGAFSLWLIRGTEGDAAPGSDAHALLETLEHALERGDAAGAAEALDVLSIGMGGMRTARDRDHVAAAIAAGRAGELGAAFARSPDVRARAVGVRILVALGNVRHTPVLASLAVDDPVLSSTAVRAIDALWSGQAPPEDAITELVAGLRFSRPAVERLLDSLGSSLAPLAAERLRDLLDRPVR